MHYFLLVMAGIVGVYALYRFLMDADVRQIKGFFLTVLFLVVVAAVFFMAVTGRLPAAMGMLLALYPIIAEFMRDRKKAKDGADASSGTKSGNDKATQKAMSRSEALEVLELAGNPSDKEIQEAYRHLIRKVHPDQKGSKWLAAKINQARDVLLQKSAD